MRGWKTGVPGENRKQVSVSLDEVWTQASYSLDKRVFQPSKENGSGIYILDSRGQEHKLPLPTSLYSINFKEETVALRTGEGNHSQQSQRH